MADVTAAIDYVLSFEDAGLVGVVTTDSGGGRTRFGIAENFHPWISQIGFYTTMSKDEALGGALVLYVSEYCLPLQIAAITNQNLANKLLSLGVNVGVAQVSLWLQEAVGAIPDGDIGPATLAAVNKADPQKALDALKAQAVLSYQQIAKDNPADEQYLAGWIARANA